GQAGAQAPQARIQRVVLRLPLVQRAARGRRAPRRAFARARREIGRLHRARVAARGLTVEGTRAMRWRGLRRLAIIGAIVAAPAAGGHPSMAVVGGGRAGIFSPGGFAAMPAATTVTTPADTVYKRDLSFRAIPMSALLGGAGPDNDIRFFAGDKATATIRVP